MAKGKRVDPVKIARILHLAAQGLSQRIIAVRVGLPYQTVSAVLKREQEESR